MSPLRQDLLQALAQVQNHEACINQDIMTFAGLMNETEILSHLESNLARVARWSERTPIRKRRSRK